MIQVARQRILDVVLVIQDVHDPHNVSACLRSAEAFGIQQCMIVHPKGSFKTSSVARGTSKWLTIEKCSSIEQGARSLRDRGYRIYAAMPSQQPTHLDELPVEQPIAVLFGNEHLGVDQGWEPWLAGSFTIPMAGMVESLNISVSAAITLQSISARKRGMGYAIGEHEQTGLLDHWICRQLPKWEARYDALRK